MATPVTQASAAPTVKFAIGTYVVLKIMSGIGDKIAEAGKSRFKKHASKLSKKARQRFSRKTMIAVGGVAVAAGIGLYLYRRQKAQEAAVVAAAAVAAKPQAETTGDVIASAMPGFDISLF